MSQQTKGDAHSGEEEAAWDFEGTRRHHIRAGLRLTYVERLRWLEETVDEMRRLQGLARYGKRIGDESKR